MPFTPTKVIIIIDYTKKFLNYGPKSQHWIKLNALSNYVSIGVEATSILTDFFLQLLFGKPIIK